MQSLISKPPAEVIYPRPETCSVELSPTGLNLAVASEAPIVPCQSWQPCLFHLDFAELPSYAIVRDQYRTWGLEVEGAIALQPSNPAFFESEPAIGLMPMVDRIPLRIYFHQSRQVVSIRLAGAKQIRLRAFDAADRLVDEQQVGQPCYLQGRPSTQPDRYQVQVQAAAISRLEIVSEAPFLLHSVTCG